MVPSSTDSTTPPIWCGRPSSSTLQDQVNLYPTTMFDTRPPSDSTLWNLSKFFIIIKVFSPLFTLLAIPQSPATGQTPLTSTMTTYLRHRYVYVPTHTSYSRIVLMGTKRLLQCSNVSFSHPSLQTEYKVPKVRTFRK